MPKIPLLTLLAIAACTAVFPRHVQAQGPPDLLLPARAGGGAATARRDVPARRQRPAQVDVNALGGESMRVQLFDDVLLTLRRATLEQVADGRFVWTGH